MPKRDATVEALLASIGIPLAYRRFIPKKGKPVPAPPYAVYYLPVERGTGADDGNLLVTCRVILEVYTAAPDGDLEARIEAALNGYEWEKDEEEIEEEGLFLITYEFEKIEKRRNTQ